MAVRFKGAHVPRNIILTCVRWYVAYPLSYRHVEELRQERGVSVNHTTVNRWVVKYSLPLAAVFYRHKRPVWLSWQLDETYIRIKGQWLPLVECGSTEPAADKEQAFAAWREETRVCLLAGVENPVRWEDEPGWWSRHLAVPSINANYVDVFYIAEDGEVGGPGATKHFPQGRVEGLWKTWSNLKLASVVEELRETYQPISLLTPRLIAQMFLIERHCLALTIRRLPTWLSI